MAPDEELIAAIGNLFKTDATLLALSGRGFFERVPPKAAGKDDGGLHYVSVGPVDSVPDDADCSVADQVTLQLDIWCPNGDAKTCRRLVAALRRRLHDAELMLEANALATLEVGLTRAFRDPDEVTMHGVVQVTATIEIP